MNTLVTGGAGFIGSHVVKHLLRANHKVVVLDDLSGGFKENIPKGTKLYKGSITEKELVEFVIKKNKIDYVFHLAAYAAEGLSHFIRSFNYENNLMGSINLINASVKYKVKCFVFTSSIAVYGRNQLPMTEDTVPSPEDPYGISKYAVELDLKAAHEMFGLDYIIFRPHNVYGEHQNLGDKYRNVIGIFMNQIMKGEPLTIFGNGLQTRAFSHIDDVAPIIADSIKKKRKAYNQVFNIGADKPYSINELIEEISGVFNVTVDIDYLVARNEVEHAYSDHSKIKQYFNLKKETSLVTGLKKMAKWAKKSGIRKSPKFKNIEIVQNLPESWK